MDGGGYRVESGVWWRLPSEPIPESVRLSISATENSVTISWSASDDGFLVEQSSDLGVGPWVRCPEPVREIEGRKQVVVVATESRTFFRLRKP
jgi:hypothetical protein